MDSLLNWLPNQYSAFFFISEFWYLNLKWATLALMQHPLWVCSRHYVVSLNVLPATLSNLRQIPSSKQSVILIYKETKQINVEEQM